MIEGSLKAVINTYSSVEIHGVIACAANGAQADNLDVFFYSPSGASIFRYFESTDQGIDEWDFNNYREVALTKEDVFNGYLKKFIKTSSTENWLVVTFEKDGKLFVSDPR